MTESDINHAVIGARTMFSVPQANDVFETKGEYCHVTLEAWSLPCAEASQVNYI
jgi:hypothetical protein